MMWLNDKEVLLVLLLGTLTTWSTLTAHAATHALAHTLHVGLIGFELFGSHDFLQLFVVGFHLFAHLGTLSTLRTLSTFGALSAGLADAVALCGTLAIAAGTCTTLSSGTLSASEAWCHHICVFCVE